MTKRDEVRDTLTRELKDRLAALSALRASSLAEPGQTAPTTAPGPFVLGMMISSGHRVIAFKNGWVLAAADSGSEYAIWKYTVGEDGQVALSNASYYYRSVHGAADAAIKAAECFAIVTEKGTYEGCPV